MKTRTDKFLVIRRDNIGDLVCTTPVFRALREKFPDASIAALVNSYNADVLAGNPNIDAIYSYTKAKHRGAENLLKIYWRRLILLLRLRRQQFDYVIVAGLATADVMRLVRVIRPRHTVRFLDSVVMTQEETIVPEPSLTLHETQRTLHLLQPLDIPNPDISPQVYPDRLIVESFRTKVSANGYVASRPRIGIHISARKPSQRWPLARFAELVRQLHSRHKATFLLLWSPGTQGNKQHPGDDEKAEELAAQLREFPILALPTPDLASLVAALSLCDQVICSDGGAMHIAAALRKPIICLFGNSDARRWYPMGAPYRLLQPGSLNVNDVATSEILQAYDDLIRSPSRS